MQRAECCAYDALRLGRVGRGTVAWRGVAPRAWYRMSYFGLLTDCAHCAQLPGGAVTLGIAAAWLGVEAQFETRHQTWASVRCTCSELDVFDEGLNESRIPLAPHLQGTAGRSRDNAPRVSSVHPHGSRDYPGTGLNAWRGAGGKPQCDAGALLCVPLMQVARAAGPGGGGC